MSFQSTQIQPQFMIYPKRRSSQSSEANMYMRVFYDVNFIEKSLGIKISFDHWNNSIREISGQPMHNCLLKEKTEEFKQKIMGAFYMLSRHDATFTLREIMDNAFNENGVQRFSLIAVFEQTILMLEKQLKPGQSIANIGKHRTCLKHLKNFLKIHLKLNDISFNRINRNFIDNFESFLKNDAQNEHNSAMKMMQIFKKIYKVAVDNRWTAVNAFVGKRISFKDVEMPYLTNEEINTLIGHDFKSNRLAFVRDLFVFCCYTGLAYIDLKTLQKKHFEFSPVSKQFFIKKKRQKTNQPFIIPLFPAAKRIIEKNSDGFENLRPDDHIFPVMSNQKYNDYLKEVAAHCCIEKSLTSHMARHSFATSIALENGVSLESTSKMLGHSKISQTQKYAKVTEIKIEKETRELFLQLQ